jgi:hypothetical protein
MGQAQGSAIIISLLNLARVLAKTAISVQILAGRLEQQTFQLLLFPGPGQNTYFCTNSGRTPGTAKISAITISWLNSAGVSGKTPISVKILAGRLEQQKFQLLLFPYQIWPGSHR